MKKFQTDNLFVPPPNVGSLNLCADDFNLNNRKSGLSLEDYIVEEFWLLPVSLIFYFLFLLI